LCVNARQKVLLPYQSLYLPTAQPQKDAHTNHTDDEPKPKPHFASHTIVKLKKRAEHRAL
jgi:hypothetical protein